MLFRAPHTHSTDDLQFPRDVSSASISSKERGLVIRGTPRPVNFKKLKTLVLDARREREQVEQLEDQRGKGKGKGKEREGSDARVDGKRRNVRSASLGEDEPIKTTKKAKLDCQGADGNASSSSSSAARAASSSFPLFAHSFTFPVLRPSPAPTGNQTTGNAHHGRKQYSPPQLDTDRHKLLLDSYKDRKTFLDSLFPDDYDPKDDDGEEEMLDLGDVWLYPSQEANWGPLVLDSRVEFGGRSNYTAVKKAVEDATIFQCGELKDGLVAAAEGSDFKDRWLESSWMNALSVLSSSSQPRVLFAGQLSLKRHKDPKSRGYLPFSFHLSIQVSLPSSTLISKCPPDLIEPQRFLFTSILPAPSPPDVYAKHDHTTTLPFFYEILQPSPPFKADVEDEQRTQSPLLEPTLMPFQRRSVRWLLEREGVRLQGKEIVEKPWDESTQHEIGREIWWEKVILPLGEAPPFGWEEEGKEWNGPAAQKGEGVLFLWNRLTGGIVVDESEIESVEGNIDLREVNGGMLCEEMGLGKTLEVISLILLSPKQTHDYLGEVLWNKHLEISYRPCTATLIVAPPTLTQQWADEIAQHAPSLKVLIYDGYKKLRNVPTAGKRTKPKQGKNIPSKRQKTLYRGRPVSDSDEEEDAAADDDDGETGEEQFWSFLMEKGADVVITTYNVLQSDFAVVKRGAGRPRREGTEYADHLKPRSPLVMIEWERVVMDEVQMQGDGKAAEMVGLIPRKYSLAVSGTPARNATKDLQQALKFLQVPILAKNDRLWNRLLAPTFASAFAKFFGYLATRTTKVQVAGEMTIPAQTRLIFPVEHTNIEQTYYQDSLSRALQDLGFDDMSNGRELDLQKARTWIHTLRQIATHLQVGNLNHNNGGGQRQNRRGGGNPAQDRLNLGAAAGSLLDLKTVLEKMMSSKLSEIRTLQSQMLKVKTNHAVYLQKAREVIAEDRARWAAVFAPFFTDPNTGDALPDDLALLNWVVNECRIVIAEVESELAKIAEVKGKDKAPTFTGDEDEEEDEVNDSSNRDVELADADRAISYKRQTLNHRLREYRELLHRAVFFVGDYWHVHGDKDKEESSYAEAEQLRRQMLAQPEREANAAIQTMTSRLVEDLPAQHELEIEYCEEGGAESLESDTDDVIGLLNSNSELLAMWRQKVFALLSTPLNALNAKERDENAEGNEYAQALEQQIEVEAFLEAYVNSVADRRELLTENRSQLAEVEARDVKKRVTKRSGEAAKVAAELGLTRNDPNRPVLRSLLKEERDACRLNPPGPKKKGSTERKCLKSRLFEFREAAERATNKSHIAIAKNEVEKLQKVITDQTTIVKELEEEIAVFRQAFNERVKFFAVYQVISDSVGELVVKSDYDLRVKLEAGQAEQRKIVEKLAPLQSKIRYMATMQTFHEKIDEGDEEDRECVICREELVKGVLFTCSHLICEDCYQNFKTQPKPECPYCRTPIIHGEVQGVLLNPPSAPNAEVADSSKDAANRSKAKDKGKGKASEKAKGKGKAKAKEKKAATEAKPKQSKAQQDQADPFKAALNIVPEQTRTAVSAVAIFGAWGSKIDMMIKCLLYLREQDPKSKAVVFSAFADALTILERAMQANGIKFVCGGSADRTATHKFNDDDLIQCFILQGEGQAPGLTLTSARYVLLCEPTVSPSFELQAIGRVDRISQKNETTVFCFQTANTMDENVVKLQLTKGLSIFKKAIEGEQAVFTTNATRRSEGKAEGEYKKAGADYIKKSADLASLLFPQLHLRNYNPGAIVDVDDEEDIDEFDEEGGVRARGDDAMVVEAMGEDEAVKLAIARSLKDAGGGGGGMEMEEDEDEVDDEQPVAGPSRLH